VFASHVAGTPAHDVVRQLASRGLAVEAMDLVTRESGLGSGLGRIGGRLRALVEFPLRAVWALTRRRPSVVVATTNPFVLPWAAVAARRLHGAKVVTLAYDLYPDVLEVAGLIRPGGLASRALAGLQAWALRSSDGVVFLGEQLAAHASERYGPFCRVAVIEMGADLAVLDAPLPPREPEPWERACEGKLVLSYVGQLGRMHDWETLAGLLRGLPPGVDVVLLGTGWGMARLRAALGAEVPQGVWFLGARADDTWLRVLRRTDLALVTQGARAARTSFPSKLFTAMAAGAAVLAIAPPASDLTQLVESAAAGVVCPPGDAATAIRAVREFQRDPARLAELRQNARRAAVERFDVAKLAERWRELLETVGQPP
jgi:glycosyltransferase involved in cell wall biosynthesis